MIEKQHSMFAFELITSLFYLWSHNRDPILIPHLKKSFTLTTTQSTLIDFAVYMAYFFMALPAGYIMKRFGYKTGIITGLMFFSIGAFLFIPAANTQSYVFCLFALFVIACGLVFLETAANSSTVKTPYLVLGNIRNKQRLKLERNLQLEQHWLSQLKNQE